ncbi:GNAT family N-acetyltransferase [Deinococcus sp. Arct2-2]|uniref:GNAT family N-acetyltransferase n=1 Tax=Deinococcus sp. Arct2-2 TaxID=2568653 RepID=UPI0010A32F74|nr:GNAT family N-acetyltransferase [Deinococcus sp. Arct2-2]THF70947.1 GNAT family N-acetyltransferase [Deinococcus sp. Arct2-2]
MVELVAPTQRYKISFLSAVREAQAAATGLGDTLNWNVDELEADFGKLLNNLRRYEPGNKLPEGFVYSESRWLVDGNDYLGRISIRYSLNERLREFGGHIGYEIRPSARRQGNGTLALKLALERTRELGIKRVLVTCDADNLGSRRVIEANKGELEGEFQLECYDRPIRRYWITV